MDEAVKVMDDILGQVHQMFDGTERLKAEHGQEQGEETKDNGGNITVSEDQSLETDEIPAKPISQAKTEHTNNSESIEAAKPQLKSGEELDEEEISDNSKSDNQDAEEDEEEVEGKDNGDRERNERGKTILHGDGNEDGSNNENSTLGRNKRVRQKNRYFADFHCIDVTKGARSSKDDYDLYTTPTITGTRSSNRRSTTDSSRAGQSDEPEVFENRYCRKCSNKTPHDANSGCQACLYKKIVKSSKRQKPASQRSRSSNTNKQQSEQVVDKDQITTRNSNNKRSTKSSSRRGGAVGNSRISNSGNLGNLNNARTPVVSNSSTYTDSGIPGSNNNPATISSPTAAPEDSNEDNIKVGKKTLENQLVRNTEANNDIKTNTIPVFEDKNSKVFVNANGRENDTNNKSKTPGSLRNQTNNVSNIISDDNSKSSSEFSNNCKLSSNVPRLDTWDSEDVADYIASKGFANEAELFKMQSVDGISLLLMQRTDFTYGLKIKLGPALKIYDQVCKLKREYMRNI